MDDSARVERHGEVRESAPWASSSCRTASTALDTLETRALRGQEGPRQPRKVDHETTRLFSMGPPFLFVLERKTTPLSTYDERFWSLLLLTSICQLLRWKGARKTSLLRGPPFWSLERKPPPFLPFVGPLHIAFSEVTK